MATFIFANNATTTLASALANTATTMAVTTGTGQLFPQPSAGQQFALTLISAANSSNQEIVYVTAVSGDTFTIVRGQEGTTAQSFVVGDAANHQWTAAQAAAMVQGSMTALSGQIQEQAGNWAQDTGTANALAVTLSPAPASLAALKGMPIRVLKSASANTGAVTLNVNGLGAKAVQIAGVALTAGQLAASTFLTVIYDGSSTFDVQSIELLGPGQFAAAPANSMLANPTGGNATPQWSNVAAILTMLGIKQFAQAYATISAGSVSVVQANGIQAITRNSAGNYTVTLNPAMPDTNYLILGGASWNGLASIAQDDTQGKTTTSFGLRCQNGSGSFDPAALYVKVESQT